ncbi:enoyl-CoA hydratase-related protein [Mangrovicoccus algicola]|uniref:Enoyl-CoA hydratase/isomerase family protein n=1 Tax=Mangrovicoccus algicola TaxID=2771008 RepID=A0A8J6YTB4_9RHOB|nr:enoyl-CoA hydratase-related protein [Mangrovicoccus algicola]MBE3637087.1 enoyl-CoA hydratase/isomerase family protein [Mangrovicoccus algicola]
MDYETIALEQDAQGVAVIRLSRPDRRNALNVRMRAELLHALKAAERDARVIVLTGAGEAFCAGQDLADRGNAASLDIERTLRDEYEPLLRAVHDCRLPVIAAVNGAAAGAGASLALCADVVIAADSAVFVQAFSRIGLIPDAGASYWLPRQVGFARAMGAMLFAEPVTAARAEEWGMIWKAVPAQEFAAHWQARAAQLAQGPTEALARIKQALRASTQNGLDAQLGLEAQLQGECGRTRDFTEGVMAFLEKRPARFEGR